MGVLTSEICKIPCFESFLAVVFSDISAVAHKVLESNEEVAFDGDFFVSTNNTICLVIER